MVALSRLPDDELTTAAARVQDAADPRTEPSGSTASKMLKPGSESGGAAAMTPSTALDTPPPPKALGAAAAATGLLSTSSCPSPTVAAYAATSTLLPAPVPGNLVEQRKGTGAGKVGSRENQEGDPSREKQKLKIARTLLVGRG